MVQYTAVSMPMRSAVVQTISGKLCGYRRAQSSFHLPHMTSIDGARLMLVLRHAVRVCVDPIQQHNYNVHLCTLMHAIDIQLKSGPRSICVITLKLQDAIRLLNNIAATCRPSLNWTLLHQFGRPAFRQFLSIAIINRRMVNPFALICVLMGDIMSTCCP